MAGSSQETTEASDSMNDTRVPRGSILGTYLRGLASVGLLGIVVAVIFYSYTYSFYGALGLTPETVNVNAPTLRIAYFSTIISIYYVFGFMIYGVAAIVIMSLILRLCGLTLRSINKLLREPKFNEDTIGEVFGNALALSSFVETSLVATTIYWCVYLDRERNQSGPPPELQFSSFHFDVWATVLGLLAGLALQICIGLSRLHVGHPRAKKWVLGARVAVPLVFLVTGIVLLGSAAHLGTRAAHEAQRGRLAGSTLVLTNVEPVRVREATDIGLPRRSAPEKLYLLLGNFEHRAVLLDCGTGDVLWPFDESVSITKVTDDLNDYAVYTECHLPRTAPMK
jgi:hypothetical protein